MSTLVATWVVTIAFFVIIAGLVAAAHIFDER